jgi:flagellar biosynthesis chaperone FliJ
VSVPANGQATFTICERRMLSRSQAISSITGEQLQNFLRDKVLDDRTFQRLKGVINLFYQIEAARQTIKQHEAEQKRIFERQQQLQQKIEPLHSDGEEGMLRQRYIASLAQLEDQLEWLDTAIAEQQALIQKLTSQVERRLQRLHE